MAAVIGLDDLARYHPELEIPSPPAPARAQAPASAAGPAVTTTIPGKRGPTAAPASSAGPQPCADARAVAAATGGYTADQLARAYRFDGLYTGNIFGAGVRVALVELGRAVGGDVGFFQQCYGIGAEVTDGALDLPIPLPPGASIEAELDVEGVLSMAPQVAVDVWQAPNSEAGFFDSFNQIVGNDADQVISDSWGVCEAALTAANRNELNTVFQEAAAQGQTIVSAAGDTGAQECVDSTGSTAPAVDDPASQPLVTGVGGTSLSALGTGPIEAVWNDAATHRGRGAEGSRAPGPCRQAKPPGPTCTPPCWTRRTAAGPANWRSPSPPPRAEQT